MDNVTHSLTGYVLARAGLDRFSPRGATLLVLAANAPDLDILFLMRGRLEYFEAHRGYSHSILYLPVMALLALLLTAAIFRQRLPWVRSWVICCIGVASHLLIDWTNNYGIRLLLPASSQWFHSDLNNLYDLWILVALAFGVVWPLFSRLVSGEIGARAKVSRGPAIFALCFFFLFDCGRAVLHSQAVAQLDSRLYEGAPAIQTAAFPSAFNPVDWTGVVETQRSFLRFPVLSYGDLKVDEAKAFLKPEMTPALQHAKSLPEFRFLSYFSRFPIWSTAPVSTAQGEGTRVELTDLRFGEPGEGAFHCIALVGPESRVLQSWFTYGPGRELGWNAAGQ